MDTTAYTPLLDIYTFRGAAFTFHFFLSFFCSWSSRISSRVFASAPYLICSILSFVRSYAQRLAAEWKSREIHCLCKAHQMLIHLTHWLNVEWQNDDSGVDAKHRNVFLCIELLGSKKRQTDAEPS